VHDAFVFAYDDRADLDLPGRLRPGIGHGTQQARRRRIDPAQRLLLQPVADRAGEQILCEGGGGSEPKVSRQQARSALMFIAPMRVIAASSASTGGAAGCAAPTNRAMIRPPQ
jgi:hypothetical protein